MEWRRAFVYFPQSSQGTVIGKGGANARHAASFMSAAAEQSVRVRACSGPELGEASRTRSVGLQPWWREDGALELTASDAAEGLFGQGSSLAEEDKWAVAVCACTDDGVGPTGSESEGPTLRVGSDPIVAAAVVIGSIHRYDTPCLIAGDMHVGALARALQATRPPGVRVYCAASPKLEKVDIPGICSPFMAVGPAWALVELLGTACSDARLCGFKCMKKDHPQSIHLTQRVVAARGADCSVTLYSPSHLAPAHFNIAVIGRTANAVDGVCLELESLFYHDTVSISRNKSRFLLVNGGAALKDIQSRFGTYLQISPTHVQDITDLVEVSIYGNRKNVEETCEHIRSGYSTKVVFIPSKLRPAVIGVGGAAIKSLQARNDVSVSVETLENREVASVTATGLSDSVNGVIMDLCATHKMMIVMMGAVKAAEMYSDHTFQRIARETDCSVTVPWVGGAVIAQGLLTTCTIVGDALHDALQKLRDAYTAAMEMMTDGPDNGSDTPPTVLYTASQEASSAAEVPSMADATDGADGATLASRLLHLDVMDEDVLPVYNDVSVHTLEGIFTSHQSEWGNTSGAVRLAADLSRYLRECHVKSEDVATVRSYLSQCAKHVLSNGWPGEAVMEWMMFVVGAVEDEVMKPRPKIQMSLFFPSELSLRRILQVLCASKTSLDVCVFTITDPRIKDAIVAAHENGVQVRVISDEEQRHAIGSTVPELISAGIGVRFDKDHKAKMHHKFALVDRRILITGSFNWTKAASTYNSENILITDDDALARRYLTEFDMLWDAFDWMTV